MFKRIEAFIRRIISEELIRLEGSVKKIDTSLDEEASKLVSAISIHTKSCMNGLQADMGNLVRDFEAKMRQEVASVVAERDHLIKQLQSELDAVKITASKISHWRADENTVASDTSLQKVK